MSKKLFDFSIGNPPYNAEFSKDGNSTYAAPVYNEFMDAANEVADKVELIHPARFLFNAGSTPKAWNEKMLHDPHFKVLHYEEDATKVFANTDIKGGVAITYHDNDMDFGPIEIFTPYESLNIILKKVVKNPGFLSLNSIAVSGYAYHFTEKMHKDHPEVRQYQSKGHEYDLKSNIIDKLPMIFLDECPKCEYVIIVGRSKNARVNKYVIKEYINDVINLAKYKILLPKASGVGTFGESLAPAIVVGPGYGNTETFFSIGAFDTEEEANNLWKYLKGKFARTMLSIMKKTQMITPGTFLYVPLQDFTATSDIDWSKSIHEIDLQLYRKYNLSKEEIDFIETNVKEMV